MVAQSGKPVSAVCHRFDPMPQILKNVRYRREGSQTPLDRNDVQTAIDDGRNRLGNAGRIVIRPSGTEPVIRVMAEGDDESLVETVVNDIVSALEGAA